MSSLQQIKDAIGKKKSISFEYNKPWKTPWKRIWDPYAVYIHTKKDWTQSTKVHIVQRSWVSDTVPAQFPDFRNFDIKEISEVSVLDENILMPLDDRYKPESPMYNHVIIKL